MREAAGAGRAAAARAVPIAVDQRKLFAVTVGRVIRSGLLVGPASRNGGRAAGTGADGTRSRIGRIGRVAAAVIAAARRDPSKAAGLQRGGRVREIIGVVVAVLVPCSRRR